MSSEYTHTPARQRIRLTTRPPMRPCGGTIAAARDAPRDPSYTHALIALILMALAAPAAPLIVSAFL
mgnify:CR=1 FL=1